MRVAIGLALLSLLCIPAAAQPGPSPRDDSRSRQSQQSQPQPQIKPLPDAPSARSGNSAVSRQSPALAKSELTLASPYQPLTDRQKFNRFLGHTISPFTFISAGMNATWLQMNGEPYSYGGGMSGWGKRFGVNLADTEARSFFSQYFFPMILSQDPRYFPMRKGNVFARGWYAGTRVLVGRSDRGAAVFNSSYLFSVMASRALSTVYAPPDRRNLETTMLNIVGAYGSDAGSLVLQEFFPDFLRLFRRHAPEKLKQIQEKIPAGMMGGTEERPPEEKPVEPSDAKCQPVEGKPCQPPRQP